MVGPSGPRRLRLAVEHLAQYRGGICFGLDLDPRWVIKLLKRSEYEEAERYKQHVVEQALTLLKAHEIRCMFTTPKLLEALRRKDSLKKVGIRGIFCGGTEMTPQFHRFAREELLGPDIYFAPTYGNTLMGLATHKPFDRGRQFRGDLLSAQAARHDRSGGSGESVAGGRARGNRAGAADYADERVFHAAVFGAGRMRAGGSLRSVSVGWGAQRPAVPEIFDDGGGGGVLSAPVASPRENGGAPLPDECV